jgi:hypothetical protein
MKLVKFTAVAGLLALAAPAYAQSSGGFGVGVTAGTLGIGPEVSFRASESFGVRANATFFKLGRNVESDGVDYDGDLKLRSFGAMADIHPFGGGFRLSAGARITRNRVTLVASPAATTTVEIGDTNYTGAQIGTLNGEIRAKKFAPTLTAGWAGGLSPGLKFGIEAGAMFQGSPRVKTLTASGPIATNAAFQAALAKERVEVENDIDNFKVYPVLQLSLGYRF